MRHILLTSLSSLVIINTFDGAAYVSGAFVVLAAAGSAAYFPSRRAAGIQPIHTLRHDYPVLTMAGSPLENSKFTLASRSALPLTE